MMSDIWLAFLLLLVSVCFFQIFFCCVFLCDYWAEMWPHARACTGGLSGSFLSAGYVRDPLAAVSFAAWPSFAIEQRKTEDVFGYISGSVSVFFIRIFLFLALGS
jgi:hypothetical protein